jgi:hypothetical protein
LFFAIGGDIPVGGACFRSDEIRRMADRWEAINARRYCDGGMAWARWDPNEGRQEGQHRGAIKKTTGAKRIAPVGDR